MQSWKERRLLCESMFNRIKKQTLILNNGGKRSFLIKPKNQDHLSQWGECVYGVQSWKEKRLLRESVFISIGRWNLILKMVGREVFLIKRKH